VIAERSSYTFKGDPTGATRLDDDSASAGASAKEESKASPGTK
jgi:hypothetical protein